MLTLEEKMNKIKYFETEINYISDKIKREDIKYLINLLPDYFFRVPASSTGKYHPKFACSEHGLLKHTKLAVRIAYDLLAINDSFSEDEKDLIIMALIMHDGLKKGIEEEKHTRFDHPLLVSKLIMEHVKELKTDTDAVRKMCMMIESHMGKWNTDKHSKIVLPLPNDKLSKFVHMCDYLASRKYLNVKFDKLEIV